MARKDWTKVYGKWVRKSASSSRSRSRGHAAVGYHGDALGDLGAVQDAWRSGDPKRLARATRQYERKYRQQVPGTYARIPKHMLKR